FLPENELKSLNYQRLFDEFHFSGVGTATRLYERKPRELLEALASKDSAIFADALDAFSQVDFTKEDLPLLQKALLVPYKDFDSTYYGNANQQMLELVEDLDRGHSTVSFIRAHYKT